MIGTNKKILVIFLVFSVFSTGMFLAPKQAEADFGWLQSIINDPGGAITHGVCSEITRLTGSVFERFQDWYNDVLNSAINWVLDALGDWMMNLLSSLLGSFIDVDVPVDESALRQLVPAGDQAIQTMQEQMDCEGFMRDTVLSTMAEKLSGTVVEDIIDWVQGEDGLARFIDNPKGFVQDRADAAFGELLAEVGLGGMCDGDVPLKREVELFLQTTRDNAMGSRIGSAVFGSETECTLSDALAAAGTTYQDYYADFRNGGWSVFRSQLSPQNNRWGLGLITSAELTNRAAQSAEEKRLEAITGDGYFGQRVCNVWQYVGDTSALWGTTVEASGPARTRTPTGQPWDGKELRPADSNWQCSDFDIITPGGTIADSMQHALGADLNFIANADRLGEYAGAILDSPTTRLTNEDVGLKNIYDPISGSFARGEGLGLGTGCDALSGISRTACEYERDLINKWDNAAGGGSFGDTSVSPPPPPPPSSPDPEEGLVLETWTIDEELIIFQGNSVFSGELSVMGQVNIEATASYLPDGVISSFSLSFDGTPISITDSVFDGAAANMQTTWDTSSLEEGTYTLEITVTATDGSSVTETQDVFVGGGLIITEFTADGGDVLSAILPEDAVEVSGSVDLFAEATSPFGIEEMAIMIDGDTICASTGSETVGCIWNTIDPGAGPMPTEENVFVPDGLYESAAIAVDNDSELEISPGWIEVYNPVGCMDPNAANTGERDDGEEGDPVIHNENSCDYELTVSVLNQGTVRDGGGINIDCGVEGTIGMCSAEFSFGEEVTLTATPLEGETFDNWTGDCFGTEPTCNLIMDGNRSVQATFSSSF